jgi:hypothetical protein
MAKKKKLRMRKENLILFVLLGLGLLFVLMDFDLPEDTLETTAELPTCPDCTEEFYADWVTKSNEAQGYEVLLVNLFTEFFNFASEVPIINF